MQTEDTVQLGAFGGGRAASGAMGTVPIVGVAPLAAVRGAEGKRLTYQQPHGA
jgi:hypothetical protein